ncbi:MAG: sigma-70 family RNA polymerase sigma factor [Acidobacteriota bacterium]|nr:sigma-70 family RNA polymerase sigma factor [Acidobacteriota bacterium]
MEDFEAFVAEAGDGLFRLAVLLSADVRAGEDLYQDTLQRLAARWAGVADPVAWSRRVMHNLAVDRFRSRRSRPAEVPSLYDGPGPADPRSADGLDAAEVRPALLQALADLTDTQRLVLALRFLEDRSEAEVADLLGVPVGTVKSTSSRAVVRLRRHPSLAHLYPHLGYSTDEEAS